MPEWLMNNENYIPRAERDAFIDKSILSLLHILSRIRSQSTPRDYGFHVGSVPKVAFTFLMIVLLSISGNLAFVITVNVYILFVLSLMKPVEIAGILKLSLIIALFTLVILLPAAFWGNYYSIMMITPKVFATVTAVNILSHTTRWNSITGALKTFFVPDIFIHVLDITIKYIVLLGEFSLNMFYSLKLRSVGKNSEKYASVSGIAGTMFLKSKVMAEDMYSAMECRGFTGEYKTRRKLKPTWADAVYIIMNIILVYAFFCLKY